MDSRLRGNDKDTMKELIKKFIPKPLLLLYHLALAKLASFYFGNPSSKLIVIGVTGTKGKSTTVYMIARILEAAGYKVGYTSTIGFKVAEREWLNDLKMTMPGRFKLQKLLRDMVHAGCQFAVIETSSEGIAQHRHVGIWYDAAVFTGLTPEHLESHGGFENYKAAKLELFRWLEVLPKKRTPSQPPPIPSAGWRIGTGGEEIPKVIVANGDSEYAEDFLDFNVDKKVVYRLCDPPAGREAISPTMGLPRPAVTGLAMTYLSKDLKLKLPGQFNIANALAALAVTEAYGVDRKIAIAALEQIETVPGRMEIINNNRGLTIVVDYAHEPESIKQVYAAIKEWKFNKLIHILGPTGGGRDKWRRPVMGELAAGTADIVIVTTDDPYDDDPQAIIREMADGARKGGKRDEGEEIDLYSIIDRREAIKKALSLAERGDLVLLTGKGSEQVMAVAGGRKVKWDDREIVREEIKNGPPPASPKRVEAGASAGVKRGVRG